MFVHDLYSFLLEVISLKGEQENGQWSNAWIGRLGIVINGQGRKESEQENYHGHRLGLEDWAWSSMVRKEGKAISQKGRRRRRAYY